MDERYKLIETEIEGNLVDRVAKIAREYGFNVKFINDEHNDGTIDYYISIYLDIYEYLLPYYKEFAEWTFKRSTTPVGFICYKLTKNALFADAIYLIWYLQQMYFLFNLYNRCNLPIPEISNGYFTEELLYRIICDETKSFSTRNYYRNSCKQLLTENQAGMKRTMYKKNFSDTIKFIEKNKWNVHYKTASSRNIPLEELDKKGQTSVFFVKDKTTSKYIAQLEKLNVYYTIYKPYYIHNFSDLSKDGGYENYELTTTTFDIYCLQKDYHNVTNAIIKAQYEGLDSLNNKEKVEELKNGRHIIFYVPSWKLLDFAYCASKSAIDFYWMPNEEVLNTDFVPFITGSYNHALLKEVMEEVFYRVKRTHKIYNPQLELKIYPDAVNYRDIQKRKNYKPANLFKKKLKEWDKISKKS